MFTTFGSFSIAAGILLIFLIFVMLAAERRSELGIARAVGTRRSHLVQTFLFEGVGLRPHRGRRRRAARARRLLRDGARDGGGLRRRSDVDDRATRSRPPASSRLRARRPADARRRRFSAWRVSRMNIVTRDPQPARAAAAQARGAAGSLGARSASCSARCSSSPACRGAGRDHARPRRLARDPRPRADRCGLRGAPDRGASTPSPASRSSSGSLLPIERWLLRRPARRTSRSSSLGGLLIVVGAIWVDHVQRRRPARRSLRASSGASGALAPVLKISMAYPLREPLPHRRDAGDVHARRLHARRRATTTGLVRRTRSTTSTRFGGGFDVRATTSPASADRGHARRARAGARASTRRTSASSRASPTLPIEGAPGRHAAQPGDLSRARRSTPRSSSTRPTGSPRWRGLRLARRGLGRARASSPTSPSSTRSSSRAGTNYNFGAAPDFRSPASTSRTDVRSGPRRRARSADRPSAHLTVIGVLTDTRAVTMAGHLDVAAHAGAGLRRPRAFRPSTSSRSRPAPTPSAPAETLESAFLANGMQADSLQAGCSTTRSPRV